MPTCIWKSAQYHQSLGEFKLKPQWDVNSHQVEWLLPKIQETTFGRLWRKGKTYTLSAGM
jgi:hypothetical protein